MNYGLKDRAAPIAGGASGIGKAGAKGHPFDKGGAGPVVAGPQRRQLPTIMPPFGCSVWPVK